MTKANASSMITDLSGGAHGHLELQVPEAKYNNITGSSYAKPTHPSKLKIKENTTLYEAIIIQKLHHEKIKLFHESAAIENALKSQSWHTLIRNTSKRL